MLVPLSIRDFLDRAALVYGDRIAIVDEPSSNGSLSTLTYQEFARRAYGMAAALTKMSVGTGERVAIVSLNAAKFLISLFGVSGSDRVLVPINYRLNPKEVEYIVRHSEASVVLIDPELNDSLSSVSARHRIVLDGSEDRELFYAESDQFCEAEQDENSLVSVNYTSGTTAMPKGVRLTQRNCWLNAVHLGWQIGISDRDVYMHTLPTFHCNGWGIPYAVTAMGCKQVIVRKIDGEEILSRMEAEGVTLLCGAPTVISMILKAAHDRIDQGRSVPGRGKVRLVVAGAPPPSTVIEEVLEVLGWEFMQLYGLTETAPLVTLNRARREWDEMPLSDRAELLMQAGPPGIGVKVRVDDSGEILTRSNHVFEGYWKQPEETDAALVDGWFHTGDEGHMKGAYLSISDRKKDVIISGGENVSSIEIENCLYQHAAVAEACVIGVPDDRWGETVKGIVVLEGDKQATEEELIDFCRDRLAHFKCPTSIDFCPSLPRTATGKLQKYKVKKEYWADQERGVN